MILHVLSSLICCPGAEKLVDVSEYLGVPGYTWQEEPGSLIDFMEQKPTSIPTHFHHLWTITWLKNNPLLSQFTEMQKLFDTAISLAQLICYLYANDNQIFEFQDCAPN
jgi:hypothetical protein